MRAGQSSWLANNGSHLMVSSCIQQERRGKRGEWGVLLLHETNIPNHKQNIALVSIKNLHFFHFWCFGLENINKPPFKNFYIHASKVPHQRENIVTQIINHLQFLNFISFRVFISALIFHTNQRKILYTIISKAFFV